MPSYERLSGLDASFLYAETPTSHMHVGWLAIVEDSGLSVETLVARIESRVHLVPRYRKKVAWVPYGAGRPVWTDDESFDVRRHVSFVELPSDADERAALGLMETVMSEPLDRARPLWGFWVFQLAGGKKGIIHKTHHALVDGVSAVDLGMVLMDASADTPAPAAPPEWTPEPAPTEEELLRDTVTEWAMQPRELLKRLRAVTGGGAAEIVDRVMHLGEGLLTFARSGLEGATTTSLTHEVGARRRYDVAKVELDRVKAVKTRFGCTINDVVLTLATAGIRALLLSRSESVEGLDFKVLVPVSVRDVAHRKTYGNMVAGMIAALPVHEPDARTRLELVIERMRSLKDSQQSAATELWMRAMDYVGPSVLALASRTILKQKVVNSFVTNVPGPQFPLYLDGCRVREVFPYAPAAGNMAIGTSVLSYDGQLVFGIASDWESVPDASVLANGIVESLAELESLPANGREGEADAQPEPKPASETEPKAGAEPRSSATSSPAPRSAV